MLKKILKHTLRTLLVILLVLLLVPALLYVPAVQDLVRRRAVAYASRTLGMEVSVESIRLAFPLRLTVDNTLLADGADTLLRCGRLSLDAALWPLIRKEVVIRNFALERVAAHYKDTLAGMNLRVAAGALSLEAARADLSANTAGIARLVLADADIRLDLTEAAPAGKKDSTAAQPWTVGLDRIAVSNLAFGMRTSPAVSELSVRLADGTVDTCRVGLESQQVSVKSVLLDRGAYSYLTGPAEAENEAPAKTAEPSAPWTVRVGSVALTGNSVEYGRLGHRPAAGFDPAFISLAPLDLTIDSVYNRGTDIALQIRRMAFTERCGLSVRDLTGRVGMDASGIVLSGFDLQTAFSRIRAELSAGAGILKLEPSSPLDAALSADLNTKDLKYLSPEAVPPVLDDRIVRLTFSATGTLGDIEKTQLEISSPGHLGLKADAAAKSLLDTERMEASARFEGDFRDLSFLKALLPDTALRRRVAIPALIRLRGSAGADRGTFSTASTLSADGGELSVKGRFNPREQRYDAAIRADSFPLNRFLPADSLGIVDLTLLARGTGFDPLLPRTRTSFRAQIDRAEFGGRDFGGIELDVELDSQRLSGRISDRDEALRLLLSVSGTLTEREQRVGLSGSVFGFDLAALGVTPEPIGGSFTLNASASAAGKGAYAARIALDSIEIRNRHRTDRIRPTSVSLRTDSAATRAEAVSGDLSLTFSTPQSADSLIASLTRSARTLAGQIDTQSVDMEQLKPALPDFALRVSAGPDNILNSLLKSRKIAFDKLNAEGMSCDSLPVSVRLRTEGLTYGNVVLDTETADIRQNGKRLEYILGLANAPGNLDNIARAGLYGHLVRNTGQVNLYQRNRAGREGFRFGLDVTWTDSLIRASVTPSDPLFGFEPWTVNPGNYLIYRFDKRVEADLDMTHGDQRFAIRTPPGGGASDDIRLDIAGLNIGPALGLFPSAPPVDGVLGANLALNLAADSLSLRGGVSVAELTYDKQRFGNVDLGLFYKQDRGHLADARLTLDGAEVLAVQGDYREERESPLDLTVTVPGFPLQQANVFLPADLLRLSGSLQARVHAGGTPGRPKLDGGVRFAGTDIRVPMIGTSFGLSADTIRIAGSRILFDDYAVYAPNKSALTVGGEISLADFRRMTADLALRASDFQFVDVARKAGTAVYGKAYLDLGATAKGPVDELVVRGNVALLGGTDISYVMQDSPMDVKERPQNVVTFVSFSELDTQTPDDTPQEVRIGGMDVLVNVDINNDVQAAVDLSADGSNRIDLRGGGNLTYTMNPLGDVRLSGKYVLSGGSVRYNPPVISQKIFKITPDSYVEWIGDIADPAFNITAVETVRANVSSDGQDARPVNFDISINIRNSLNDLAISFGLAAPEDLTMQNQLNSLTAEQRANQAMNLLIYNTYTGPGTTAKVSSENPLNTFIQKELNQWAQNNLKGVDLTFGIDSHGEDDPNGQRTDYSYRLSKNLFNNRVRAVIGGKFSTDADPSQNLKENLIDDISLEYMLTKRDNMYLKVFRHTGYESILEGEITETGESFDDDFFFCFGYFVFVFFFDGVCSETGVGFVIRKKLSRLGDLFKPMRPKTKKPKK